jgi:hypothetical protein
MLLPLIDKITDYLPGWKASLMNKAGRLVLVRAVLTAAPIYLLIAMDLPKWYLKAIDKKCRVFSGRGRNKQMVATPWSLGKGCSGPLNSEDLEFIIWSF